MFCEGFCLAVSLVFMKKIPLILLATYLSVFLFAWRWPEQWLPHAAWYIKYSLN